MKYNEAIDMILDGGKMHRNSDKFYYKFSPEGLLHQWWKYKNEVCIETSITKNDCITTDWIVEKDGVVYEESPCNFKNSPNGYVKVTAYIPHGQLWKIHMTENGLKKLNDLKESGHLFIDMNGVPLERIELKNTEQQRKALPDILKWKDTSPKYEQPKQASIDEDWLEKKMLCVIRREHFSRFNHTTVSFPEAKCHYPKCPFCFPENTADKCKKMIKETLEKRGIIQISKNGHIDEPREKVTVEDIIGIIKQYGKSSIYNSNLLKRIEYLVSLQGAE